MVCSLRCLSFDVSCVTPPTYPSFFFFLSCSMLFHLDSYMFKDKNSNKDASEHSCVTEQYADITSQFVYRCVHWGKRADFHLNLITRTPKTELGVYPWTSHHHCAHQRNDGSMHENSLSSSSILFCWNDFRYGWRKTSTMIEANQWHGARSYFDSNQS